MPRFSAIETLLWPRRISFYRLLRRGQRGEGCMQHRVAVGCRAACSDICATSQVQPQAARHRSGRAQDLRLGQAAAAATVAHQRIGRGSRSPAARHSRSLRPACQPDPRCRDAPPATVRIRCRNRHPAPARASAKSVVARGDAGGIERIQRIGAAQIGPQPGGPPSRQPSRITTGGLAAESQRCSSYRKGRWRDQPVQCRTIAIRAGRREQPGQRLRQRIPDHMTFAIWRFLLFTLGFLLSGPGGGRPLAIHTGNRRARKPGKGG